MKPYRNKKYLDWIRSQNCCVTGSNQNIVAHHIISCGMGGVMGSKVSDLFAIPLTAEEHYILHNNPKEFERRYDQKRICLETIEKAINEGVLSVC